MNDNNQTPRYAPRAAYTVEVGYRQPGSSMVRLKQLFAFGDPVAAAYVYEAAAKRGHQVRYVGPSVTTSYAIEEIERRSTYLKAGN